MSKVTDKVTTNNGKLTVICDFSPPRGVNHTYLEQAGQLDVDFLCVAYNPGKSVRLDSMVTAYTIKQHTGKDVIFNLAARDMNKLAIQSHLLGAQALGLENVTVVKGDEFTDKELAFVKPVNDFKTTELIRAIVALNEGMDFKGLRLRVPTSFCIGSSIDLSKGIEAEARLSHKKATAGAHFFITQSIYDVNEAKEFLGVYASLAGEGPRQPIFYGIQVLEKDGLMFGDIPDRVRAGLEQGRPGFDIAAELIHEFMSRGLKSIYLVPPILKGGVRNYEAVQRVLELCR